MRVTTEPPDTHTAGHGVTGTGDHNGHTVTGVTGRWSHPAVTPGGHGHTVTDHPEVTPDTVTVSDGHTVTEGRSHPAVTPPPGQVTPDPIAAAVAGMESGQTPIGHAIADICDAIGDPDITPKRVLALLREHGSVDPEPRRETISRAIRKWRDARDAAEDDQARPAAEQAAGADDGRDGHTPESVTTPARVTADTVTEGSGHTLAPQVGGTEADEDTERDGGAWAVAEFMFDRGLSGLPVDRTAEILTLATESWTPAAIGQRVGLPASRVLGILEAAARLRPYFPDPVTEGARVTSNDAVHDDRDARTADLPRLTPDQEAAWAAELAAWETHDRGHGPESVTGPADTVTGAGGHTPDPVVTPTAETVTVTAPVTGHDGHTVTGVTGEWSQSTVTPADRDRGVVTVGGHTPETVTEGMTEEWSHPEVTPAPAPVTPPVTVEARGDRAAAAEPAEREQRSWWVAGACYAVAVVSLLVSLNTSWRFFDRVLHIPTAYGERQIMFAVAELALVVCGAGMAVNVHRDGRPGSFRLIVWAMCSAMAYMAYAESDQVGEAIGRILLGPVLGTIMLHLGLGLELRARHPQRSGTLARIGREQRERFLARFGLADDNRTAAQRTRDRHTHRAAALSRPRRWPWSRTARLERALLAAGVADDPAMMTRLESRLAVVKHAPALRDIDLPSPWERARD